MVVACCFLRSSGVFFIESKFLGDVTCRGSQGVHSYKEREPFAAFVESEAGPFAPPELFLQRTFSTLKTKEFRSLRNQASNS